MKAILRNDIKNDTRNTLSLTLNREYSILGIEADFFRILNDNNEPVLFDPLYFEIRDPQEPSFWHSTFGSNGERYSYPPGWNVEGFFEEWHDGVTIIRQIFDAQLLHWYPPN